MAAHLIVILVPGNKGSISLKQSFNESGSDIVSIYRYCYRASILQMQIRAITGSNDSLMYKRNVMLASYNNKSTTYQR